MTARRVLIVEDEAMIAMMLETYLGDLGYESVGVASNVQDALKMATTAEFDMALLDVNLNGQKAHVLPGVLQRRGKPFAFVTGYGDQGVLDAYANAPMLLKPFLPAQLAAVLVRLGADSPSEK